MKVSFAEYALPLFMLLMPWFMTAGAHAAEQGVSIIPQPLNIVVQEGSFALKPDTAILTDKSTQAIGKLLARWLAPATGYSPKLKTEGPATDNSILLKLDPSLSQLGDEGYLLEVTPQRVMIRAPKEAGVFYGVQSLRQLLPPAIFAAALQPATWSVPCVKIEDYPRFRWRGAMLDVSRHFMPKWFVLKFIDLLALYKMNRFHWHLTDDQGWRIEIKKHPKLTRIGSMRKQTRLGHERNPRGFDKVSHGGFYTQADIREVVEYARQRFITIVPEIEMPGHAQAAVAAYPELGAASEKVEVWTSWGISKNIFNPGERTILFLQDALKEVLDLFPGPFIHVGGDEAVKDQWKAGSQVQARIKELGLKDEEEMQGYVIRRMAEFLRSQGRRLIGWDEILEGGGLPPGAAVMSWRGVQGGISAAKAGHDVVMAPTSHTYLDYYQSKDEGEPLSIGGFLPLETVYEFEPVPAELSPEEAQHILGAQCQLWSEYLPSPGHVEYMAFPRLLALAEVVWTPKDKKDLANFLDRMVVEEQRLTYLDTNFKPTKGSSVTK